MTHTEEMSTIDSVTLQNVEVQSNGIIRNSQGYLIGRLVDSVDYKGDHVKGVSETDKSLLSTQREEILAKVEALKKDLPELTDETIDARMLIRVYNEALEDLKQSLKEEGK